MYTKNTNRITKQAGIQILNFKRKDENQLHLEGIGTGNLSLIQQTS
jgi:hypothetical protein